MPKFEPTLSQVKIRIGPVEELSRVWFDQIGLDRILWERIGLDRIRLVWIGLDRVEMDRGSGWIELGRIEACWDRSVRTDQAGRVRML